MILPRLVILQ